VELRDVVVPDVVDHVDKSPAKSRPALFVEGGVQGPGRGPKPGAPNAGAPSGEIRALCRALIGKHDLLTKLAELAISADADRDKLGAMKLLMAYGFGQPTQVIEHTGKDGEPLEVIHTAQAAFQGRMDRLAASLGAATMPEWPERS
jgi:hypothetical protein